MTSCSQKKQETVDIATALQFDTTFSGTRTITMTFPESVVSAGSSAENSLDKVVQKYCPDSMNYAKNMADGKIVYSFTLKFTSAHDYTQKVEKIIGIPVKVAFSNPNTVLTQGWKLEEDFESSQLLTWLDDGIAAEKFEDLSFTSAEMSTTAALDDDKIAADPMISVNNLSGYPIQKIRIDTVNEKTVFDRTITFTISQTTFDQLNDQLSNYFKSITDGTAKSEWLLENNSYLYKVRFDDISLQELEGYTNHLLSSVYCDASYHDKSIGSTPLAEQNSFTETLDFSNYISNSNTNVPIEYTYRVEGSSELSECQLYENGEWTAATNLMDTNQYGKLSAIKSTDSMIKLRINDGKQYTCSSIDINCTPLDDNLLQKSVTFKYDIATGGNEAGDYTTAYFKNIHIGAVQSTEGGKSTCTVTFSGTPEEVNTSISNIFGSANQMKFSEYIPSMTLRTMKQFTDHVDLSTLIVGKNIDTPINYTVTTRNGDILKTFKAVYPSENDHSSTVNADLTPDENGTVSMRLDSFDSDVSFDVSTPNIADIIAMCVFSAYLIIVALIVIFILKSRKNYLPLNPGENPPPLPESQHKMTVSKKKKEGF